MADDSLFNDPAPDPVVPPVVPDPPAEPASGNGVPAALTLSDVQQMIQPLQADLNAAQVQNAQLQTELTRLQNPAPPDPTQDEFLDGFTSDPRGTIKDLATEVSSAQMAQLAPILTQQIDTTHQSLTDLHRTKIDAEYGAGAWDAEIQPAFEARMAHLRQNSMRDISDPGIVEREVAGMAFSRISQLMERKAAAASAVTDTETAEQQAMIDKVRAGMTGMTGGLSAPVPGNPNELSDAEKDYRASKALSGETFDSTAVRASATRGNSLADYRKAMKAAKKEPEQ